MGSEEKKRRNYLPTYFAAGVRFFDWRTIKERGTKRKTAKYIVGKLKRAAGKLKGKSCVSLLSTSGGSGIKGGKGGHGYGQSGRTGTP